jgi:hypothetical protein
LQATKVEQPAQITKSTVDAFFMGASYARAVQ